MTRIKKNLKETQDQQKIYADNNRNEMQFALGDHGFLKVNPRKNSSNLGNCSKLATKYYEPFEILNRVGPVACELALPTSIKVHKVFHVSLLKKCIPDESRVIDWNTIQVNVIVDMLKLFYVTIAILFKMKCTFVF